MDEQLQMYISESTELCRQLINMLDKDEDEILTYFGGDLYDAYRRAIDIVKDETKSIQSKIMNLQ